MLTFSAADFEDFLEPRPDLVATLEAELHAVVGHLAANRWPFRLHATYDESISRFLDVFEVVNRDTPFDGLHWFFDHAETVSTRNLERIKALGGGIAIQHRMAYQGEYFVNRYGAKAAEHTPPVAEMLKMGIPVSAGTDATRVASYNPWVCLYWLVTGKTVGGLGLYPEANLLSREQALRLYTQAGTWFSSEDGKKGTLAVGQYADLAILSDDYFTVEPERIKGIEAVLTIVDGRVVYAAELFAEFTPPPLAVSPDWSPAGVYGGYGAKGHAMHCRAVQRTQTTIPDGHVCNESCGFLHWLEGMLSNLRRPAVGPDLWGAQGCGCWASKTVRSSMTDTTQENSDDVDTI